MNIVKKLLRFFVFFCGMSSVFVFLSSFVERFGYVQATPGLFVLVDFALGALFGAVCLYFFDKKKSRGRKVLAAFGELSFAFFGAMIGFAVGATLGGNGILTMEWGGLGGYEAVGFLGAMLMTTLCTFFGYSLLSEKGLGRIEVGLASLIAGLLGLLVTAQSAEAVGPVVFFFPIAFVWILSFIRPRLHTLRRGGR